MKHISPGFRVAVFLILVVVAAFASCVTLRVHFDGNIETGPMKVPKVLELTVST